MKFKRESGGLYCCSTYDNKGKDFCDRVIVKEEFLRSLIERRNMRKMEDLEIKEIVDYILIESSILLEIHFKNQQEPILLQGNFVQF